MMLGTGTRRAAPAVIHASQSGGSTLDDGEGGGNPFASALVELLARPALTIGELRSDIVARTLAMSGGFQEPDVPATIGRDDWALLPPPTGVERVALVLVYVDYRHAGVTPLPGAWWDMHRVGRALSGAGFRVIAMADPAAEARDAALRSLARDSAGADVAVVYVTGHGVEHAGEVFLVPGDFPYDEGPDQLPERAVRVAGLTDHLFASRANIVFHGGCRAPW